MFDTHITHTQEPRMYSSALSHPICVCISVPVDADAQAKARAREASQDVETNHGLYVLSAAATAGEGARQAFLTELINEGHEPSHDEMRTAHNAGRSGYLRNREPFRLSLSL